MKNLIPIILVTYLDSHQVFFVQLLFRGLRIQCSILQNAQLGILN